MVEVDAAEALAAWFEVNHFERLPVRQFKAVAGDPGTGFEFSFELLFNLGHNRVEQKAYDNIGIADVDYIKILKPEGRVAAGPPEVDLRFEKRPGCELKAHCARAALFGRDQVAAVAAAQIVENFTRLNVELVDDNADVTPRRRGERHAGDKKGDDAADNKKSGYKGAR